MWLVASRNLQNDDSILVLAKHLLTTEVIGYQLFQQTAFHHIQVVFLRVEPNDRDLS